MYRWLLIPLLLLLTGCNDKIPESYFTAEKAIQYFKEVKEICDKDDGQLWGKNLYGPLVYIDRVSRKIIANQPDQDGLLKFKDGVYNGLYPKEQMIHNAIVEFGGTRFAAVTLPQTEDEYFIKTRSIRGLFHRFQQEAGIMPSAFNITSMDKRESRLWIKLEWKALRNAIASTGDARQLAVRDALIFRHANNSFASGDSAEKTRFENYEGLSTFTFILFATNSPDEFKQKIFDYLDWVYSFQSYARSYGFAHGALYSTLLYEQGFDFKTINSDTIDLGNKVREVYNVVLPDICRDVAGSLALNYGIDEIYKEEEIRLTEIKESIHEQVSRFTEKPVVFLELKSPYFNFEPENIHSLDTLGTLYRAIRVSDNWGKLTVDNGGCLVSNNFKFIRITAKSLKEDKNHIEGDGWNLILNDGWEIVKVNENYFVRTFTP